MARFEKDCLYMQRQLNASVGSGINPRLILLLSGFSDNARRGFSKWFVIGDSHLGVIVISI